jgi:hypothetical protein
LIVALSLWASAGAALGARKPLSDAQLDKITAGGISAIGTKGMDAGGVLVGGGASAVITTDSQVNLTAEAPGHLRVLNLTNASTSSVSNAANVWDSQSAGGISGGDVVHQSNNFFQSGPPPASVARWSLDGKIVNESSQFSSFSLSSTSHQMFNSVIDQSFSSQSSIINTQATVPSYNPFNSVIHIGSIAPNPFTIPQFGFGINAIVGSDDTKFGFALSGSVGPFNVSPGSVDFGSLDLSSPTLTLSGGTISLPSISGAASGSGEICFFECASASGSGTFTESGASLGQISVPPISLGSNPFYNFKIQAGGGVAGAGSGTISASAGSVGVNLSVSLQIPPINGQSISIGGPVNLGPFGTINIPTTTVSLPSITFPSFSTSIPLVQASLGGFSASFHDAAFCLDVTGNSAQCGKSSAYFQDTSYHDQRSSSSQTTTTSTQQSSSFQTSSQIIYPAVLLGARGGYLALTGGALSSTDNSSVRLAGPVEQGLNAVNLVNAAQSELVNGMNVAADSYIGSELQLSQTNLVTQVK